MLDAAVVFVRTGKEVTMALDLTEEKQHAHELIDRLDAGQLSAVVGLLKVILDPVSRKLANAPLDDEPETEDERQAVQEAKDWLQQHGGEGIPHDEVLREFDLK